MDYLLEIQISVFRDMDCCLYMEGRKEKNGIITVDYLLQYRFLVYIGTDILIHSWAITYISLEPFL